MPPGLSPGFAGPPFLTEELVPCDAKFDDADAVDVYVDAETWPPTALPTIGPGNRVLGTGRQRQTRWQCIRFAVLVSNHAHLAIPAMEAAYQSRGRPSTVAALNKTTLNFIGGPPRAPVGMSLRKLERTFKGEPGLKDHPILRDKWDRVERFLDSAASLITPRFVQDRAAPAYPDPAVGSVWEGCMGSETDL